MEEKLVIVVEIGSHSPMLDTRINFRVLIYNIHEFLLHDVSFKDYFYVEADL